MKKVGIAARLLAVVAVLSLAAFVVVGCGGDKSESSSNSSGDSSAASTEFEAGDTVGESKKVVVDANTELDAEQKAVIERIGEFADATDKKDYKTLCNDILSEEASKIGGDCVKTFSQTGAQLKDFEIKVKSVKIGEDGKTATADVEVTSNVNESEQAQNLSLIKENGEWRIQILGQ
ncbi:MAG: hypothetical protein ACSLFF_08710 [Solirubrobacterales bacterium]